MSELSVPVPLSAFPFRSIAFKPPNRLYPFGSALGTTLLNNGTHDIFIEVSFHKSCSKLALSAELER